MKTKTNSGRWNRLLGEMKRPRTYPHPVKAVTISQTHISCVFLTGRYAYKIKKPVNFGFIDYSTLRKRSYFCRKEVQLNRRLSPDVYIGVCRLVKKNDGLRVGGNGSALEWAVKMRELPFNDVLSLRLDSGTVSREHIRQLARQLAQFHRNASHNSQIDRFGKLVAISRNVEENFQQTKTEGTRVLPLHQKKIIENFARQFLKNNESLFIRRVQDGHIRDCHGDLRAQNIYFARGIQRGIQILDCIEFNDRFRYIDVASDIAYLAMDLDFAARRDLRESLLASYLKTSKDLNLFDVLPFYLCYRAFVRGKIALLASREREIPKAERKAHAKTAMAAFDLACSYTCSVQRPVLIIMVGFSGSGKSILAFELARRLPAVLISTDSIRKEIAGVPPGVRLERHWYTPARIAAMYRELRRRAGDALQNGQNAVLDATFLSRKERRLAASLADDLAAQLWIVECISPDELIRKRLALRAKQAGSASDAGLAVYEAQLQQHDPVERLEKQNSKSIVVDTSRPAGNLCRIVLREFWAF